MGELLSLSPLLQAFLATVMTWALTAAGAALVIFTRQTHPLVMDGLLAFGAGVMLASAYWSLLAPAIDLSERLGQSSFFVAACGFLSGGLLLMGCDGLLSHLLSKYQVNIFFEKIISSFLMAMAACGMAALGWTDNVDTVMIGTLMLLVPGVLFTNALRDIIFGDTNSGVNRIVETLLIAVAVASGTAVVWRVSDILWQLPVQAAAVQYSPIVACIMSLIACAGFVIVFNIHGAGNWLCALGGGIAWAVYSLVAWLGGGLALCCLAATVVSAIYAEIMARVRKYPAISYLVISLLPMIPGAGIYYCAQYAMAGDYLTALNHGGETMTVAGMIAVGILLVSTITRSITMRKTAGK